MAEPLCPPSLARPGAPLVGMPDLLILITALVLLVLLLSSEKQGRTPWGVYVKGSVSALFVLTALIQPHPNPAYYHAILLGLLFGLVGDVCLALPGNRAFRVGLFAFLGGHVFYVWAFARLTRPEDWASPIQLILLAVGGGAFWWLRSHVGKMMVPVTVYLIVITLMLAGAWAVIRNPDLRRSRQMGHPGRGPLFLPVRSLCRSSTLRHGTVPQPADRVALVLRRSVSDRVFRGDGRLVQAKGRASPPVLTRGRGSGPCESSSSSKPREDL